jgi:hypothetical protein
MSFTKDLLSRHIAQTNILVRNSLSLYDPSATSKMIGTMELGFPNDVIRLAGGFATGLYLEWMSSMPFIPVDATVNVCTTSVFLLSEDIYNNLTVLKFQGLNNFLSDFELTSNFHRGNHFVIYAKSRKTKQCFLILHSDAYKTGFDSISPEPENWYYDNLSVYTEEERYLRYITGDYAKKYYLLTKENEKTNCQKHMQVAKYFLDGKAELLKEDHYHHHFMPTQNSIAIGCYLIKSNSTLPILTYPGKPIYIYNFSAPYKSDICVGDKFLVPHGWGRHINRNVALSINLSNNTLLLDNSIFPIQAKATINAIEGLKVREYDLSNDSDSYLYLLEKEYSGMNIDYLDQCIAYTKTGYKKYME